MDTGHSRYFTDLLYDIHADIDTFFLWVLCALQTFNNLIRNIKARHEFFHIPRHANRLGGRYPCKDIDFFMETKVSDDLHEPGKLFDIVNDLGLYEACAGLYLLGHSYGPILKWVGKGICRRTEKKPWFMRLDFITALEFFIIPHGLDHTQELYGVHVKDTLCLGMVSKLLVISGKAQEILYAKCRSPQDI